MNKSQLEFIVRLDMLAKQSILNQTIRTTFYLSMLFASHGCETIVEVDLPEHTPVIVANSFFNPDSVWQVKLYKSKGKLQTGVIESVTNATVEIIHGENVVRLSHTQNGIYRATSDLRPNTGATYTLKASAPNFAAIEASDFVPVPVPIASVDIDSSLGFKLTINFSDPADDKNYYQLVVLEEWRDYDGKIFVCPAYFETDDLIFQELGDINPDEALFDDSLISGKNYSLKIRAFKSQYTRQIYVLLLSVTESYFKYIKSTQAQENNEDNPFATPVQVFNNIEEGLGIFAGYSISIIPIL